MLTRRTNGKRRPARVVLVRPPSVVARFALTLNATPPISSAYLAGSLSSAGHHVRVVDAVGEAPGQMRPGFRDEVLQNGLSLAAIVESIPEDTELVGITCLFSHEWPVVRELIAQVGRSRPRARIVIGGEHPTAVPELCLREAPGLTACALGEGEETIVDLADAVSRGESFESIPGLLVRTLAGSVRTPPRGRIGDVDAIPLPLWQATPIERYLSSGFSFGVDRGRTMPIVATRGCPYRCTFCSSPQMWTTKYQTRSPARVVDEIEGYVDRYGAENFDFYDLTAIIGRRWILDFCRELTRRGLRVSWQLPSGTRSEAIDREVCEALFASGCRNVSYAPESGSVKTLGRIQKKVKPERMLGSMRAAVGAGLNVKANILMGFPGETRRDMLETLGFILKMAGAGVHDVSVWTFAPYPGSALFEELRLSGVIGALDDDYYASLLSYSNLREGISYSEHVPSALLKHVRAGWLLAFYVASYGLHPSRPFRTVRNMVTRRYESRLEMSLTNLLRRLQSEVAGRSHSSGDGVAGVHGGAPGRPLAKAIAPPG